MKRAKFINFPDNEVYVSNYFLSLPKFEIRFMIYSKSLEVASFGGATFYLGTLNADWIYIGPFNKGKIK